MKLAVFIIASGFAKQTSATKVGRARRQDSDADDQRRYSQLIDQMSTYNPQFDERKYWTYGCHCLMLGDRPMSEMGRGTPMDALDVVCRAYKECQKCARQNFGQECLGEFYSYGYTNDNTQTVCTDDANSCKRSLCECDRKFAIDHFAASAVYTDDYHRFWGNFDSETQCIPTPGGATDPQCCTNSDYTSPFILYNSYNKECCTSGEVLAIGNC